MMAFFFCKPFSFNVPHITPQISISDFLTLFSSRTGGDWFFSSSPAPILLGAGALALSCSTIVAITWPYSNPDGIETEGLGYLEPYAMPVYVWIYCILWWFIQDAVKVLSYRCVQGRGWPLVCSLFDFLWFPGIFFSFDALFVHSVSPA